MHNHFINYNGEHFPEQDPVFTSTNRAFRYGDGLFESIRIIKGEVKFLDFHADRLKRGLQTLAINNYADYTPDFMARQIHQLANSNRIFDNARVRFSVFREGNGLYTPQSNRGGFLIEIQKTDDSAYEINRKGVIIELYKGLTKDFNALSGFKTCNSLTYIMAAIHKQANGVDDCIILNSDGYLVESIASNIFLVKNGEFYTPALSEGCVDGVMRRAILTLAKHTNLKVHEVKIKPEALRDADEIFLTNAISGLLWVVGYQEKRFFNSYSKMLVEMLNRFSV